MKHGLAASRTDKQTQYGDTQRTNWIRLPQSCHWEVLGIVQCLDSMAT